MESIRTDVEAPAGATKEGDSSNLVGAKFDSVTTLHRRVIGLLDDFADFATETMAARSSEMLCLTRADEAVDLSQLLDEVAKDMWNAQVNEIRTEQGIDARVPPPPELILRESALGVPKLVRRLPQLTKVSALEIVEIDTNLRGWKSLVSPSALKRVCAKLISVSKT